MNAIPATIQNLPAWLAFVGALVVAVITAVTADRRQQKQLAAETDRQQKQLDAETVRLREQFSFERGETDLAELRAILDALAAHVFAIKEGVDEVVLAAEWRVEEGRVELRDMWEKRHKETTAHLETELDQAARQIQRARLRLGSDLDPVAREADIIRHHGQDVRLRLPASLPPDAWRRNLDGAQRTREDLKGSVGNFVTEARKFTAARLHEEPRAD